MLLCEVSVGCLRYEARADLGRTRWETLMERPEQRDAQPGAVFQPFDPHGTVRIYRRHLPHWRQDGATYFVTFRLADSLPRLVVARWQEEDAAWLGANGVLGPLTEARWRAAYERIDEDRRREFEKRAARRLHVELDRCHGGCLLRQPLARTVVLEAMRYFDGGDWLLGDMVVMPNHVHGLVKPVAGCELERGLQSVKRFVSTRLGKAGLKETGPLWQKENYDHIVRDRKELAAFRRYIAENPRKAALGENEFLLYRAAWLDQ